ncbi:malto-oligosyltrehalose trehalohydrolase [Acidomonas methanolica]|uniref:Malto-oligosyltrehalose trehalohydrolase n=1 Tax=Acidomonas methanolica NBRC 104435 TaxID=1231351 RepID=A0A023D6V0_ACIMT|nr:malto-oligosyltrehalose trehalohydrolase [Acidomonas methanolica]MBU2655610.1 malto-oligosyltrehalose trehalohydrolase [Acidomonas methanolica]TCS21437.1 maltooligosyltrehalose trehalohydrolase [Acidomonas methanolica]GAJ29455.1 malto-oligosyltrehalose trehalohydrolase [Acidomonas methanolica NBRC 104435]GBQ57411.1 malto-oligosyltrehalose trehalohydrolase [Acidomonas methanolica]GEL00374.1 malto-oligosyltrehalose trehalohydrolase [Acidomonas methanolica NBRC 104435]
MPFTERFQPFYGPTLLPAGGTLFRLWAPSCQAVALEIEGQPPRAMKAERDGLFSLVAQDAGPGTRYRYRVADDLAVPDPASRFQPDGVHGFSLVTDPDSYGWRHAEWRGRPWEEAVIYELHAGLLGGFAGVREKLGELAELGVTAIEIMPVNSFGGTRNWGYDGVLPYAPAASYGAPDDLKALIDAAHGHGLMVFLDVVYNHFGPDGNYLAAYADAFFDRSSNSHWGEGIAFRRPQVARFFHDNVMYWLTEFRFDGVRIDAASAITDRDWFPALLERVRAEIPPGRQVHLILENENNDAALLRDGFTAQWNDDGHNALHVLLTGETEGYYGMFAEAPARSVARVLGEGFDFQGRLNPYSGRMRGQPSGDLPPTKFILFLQNHDQTGNRALGERLTTLADPQALRAAYALLLLCPQIPMLFMGEEWGTTTPFFFFTDFQDALADAVREGRRREFATFAAFSSPSARARIPDPNAPATFERSRPDRTERDGADGRAWLALTAELLALRRDWIVPRLHGARALGAEVIGPKAVAARWRMSDGTVLGIALNLGEETLTIAEPARLLHETTERKSGALPGRSVVIGMDVGAGK